MGVRLVNLTPHDIHLVDDNGDVYLTIPASGEIARCASTVEDAGEIVVGEARVRLTRTVLGELEGLPPPQE